MFIIILTQQPKTPFFSVKLLLYNIKALFLQVRNFSAIFYKNAIFLRFGYTGLESTPICPFQNRIYSLG